MNHDTSTLSQCSNASCVSDTIANDAADELKRLSALLRSRAKPTSTVADPTPLHPSHQQQHNKELPQGEQQLPQQRRSASASRPVIRGATSNHSLQQRGTQRPSSSTVQPTSHSKYTQPPTRGVPSQRASHSTAPHNFSLRSSSLHQTSLDSRQSQPSARGGPQGQDLQRLVTKLQRSLKSTREMELLLTRQHSLLEEAHQQLRVLDRRNNDWK